MGFGGGSRGCSLVQKKVLILYNFLEDFFAV